MSTILIAAFAAGMVSTVNPCGFAMLPAYLGFFLGDRRSPGHRGVGRVAAAVAAGFLAVFTVAGTLVGLGARAVIDAIPWLALVVGAGLVLVGVGQVAGKRLLPYFRGPDRVRRDGSLAGMASFGASYAVASLSCTLPIFLSLVTGAVASGSPVEAVLTFVSYGAGMALVVVAITVSIAAGRRGLIDRIRPLAGKLDRISGWIMIAAGVFIVWYWATVLRSGAAALGSNPLVRFIDEISADVTGLIGDRPLIVGGLILTLLVASGWWWTQRTSGRPDGAHEPSPPPTPVPPRR